MNPIKTVLIVLDPQNDLTSSSGKLFPATQPVLDKFNVINHINQLTDDFRHAGATIIYSPIVFSKGYPEVGNNPYGVMTSVIASEAMVKGTSGAEISQQFTMKDEDIILERSAIIAFEGTNLTQILKDKGITTIILCGLLSDICVEGTMRAAYSKGFEVFTLIDATATLSLEKQAITLEHSYPLFSKVIKTEEALSLIKR
ncbi:MAG: nicotinamidase-related amidase [Cognaticolwellia sp.]|jgi:nicotinamidase-related amidase